MLNSALANVLRDNEIPPSALMLATPEPVYDVAAVGDSCACGNNSGCAACGPPSMRCDQDTPCVPGRAARTPAAPNGSYRAYVDRARDRRCLTPIPSAPTTIPAGTTVAVEVEPSRGCAHAYYISVIAIDDADVQTEQRFQLGRIFIGNECPQDCRIEGLFSDFLQSEDCLGCPFDAIFGLEAVRENLQVEVTNINTEGSIRVQVTVWAVCLPGYGCLADACRAAA